MRGKTLEKDIREILVHYKGKERYDAAFFYAPYMPEIPQGFIFQTRKEESKYKPIDLSTLRGLP